MTSPAAYRLSIPPVLFVVVAICAGIELVLQLADYGFLANTGLRSRAYEYAGFWPGLMHGWQPTAVLAGALIFGLLARSTQPMVGASGGLFGLAGAVLAWSYIDRFNAQLRLWPVAWMILFLIALNLVLWWAMDGLLAWQTHLGGFIGGWVAALLINPRPQQLPE